MGGFRALSLAHIAGRAASVSPSGAGFAASPVTHLDPGTKIISALRTGATEGCLCTRRRLPASARGRGRTCGSVSYPGGLRLSPAQARRLGTRGTRPERPGIVYRDGLDECAARLEPMSRTDPWGGVLGDEAERLARILRERVISAGFLVISRFRHVRFPCNWNRDKIVASTPVVLPATKTGPRRVALSPRAVRVLEGIPRLPDSPWGIPGMVAGVAGLLLAFPAQFRGAAAAAKIRLHGPPG